MKRVLFVLLLQGFSVENCPKIASIFYISKNIYFKPATTIQLELAKLVIFCLTNLNVAVQLV
jgi:hypothetical protein